MDFAVTESQRMIADTIARLFSDDGLESRRDRLSHNPPNRLALWPQLVENGVLGGFFPEEVGGFGGEARDVAVIFYEVGKALAVEPLFGALMASRILLSSYCENRDALIEELISAEHIFVFAHVEAHDPYTAPSVRAVASDDGKWYLTGGKPVVRHGDVADRIIVTAQTEGGVGCFLVDVSEPGVAIEKLRLIDATGGANLELTDAPATEIIAPGEAQQVIERALDWGLAALAAEVVGIMDVLNEQTREYLRVRKQFGVPLASFQALQHRAADMYVAGEEASVSLHMLIDALDGIDSSDAASARWSAMKMIVDKAGRKVGHEAMQLHGGMGVSDEMIVSHYAKRLTSIRAELGGVAAHRKRVAALGEDCLEIEEDDEVKSFRKEVRDFVAEHCPPDLRRKTELGLAYEKADYLRWERILRAKGWLAGAWPREYGGPGWDLGRQLTFVQEAALNNAPPILPFGLNMVGPVIYTFGSEEQKRKYLPGILESRTWWCQGYSEPNAGSDLASLKTFAERDGDHYIVNGTKMWTTEAQSADMMHCLVRTSREGRSQDGITFLLIDMQSPGISIQPIITLDGQYHTNQTFFDNVRVPVENVVGREGEGWKFAKFLLGNERIAIADTGPKMKLLQHIRGMLADAEKAYADSPDIIAEYRARLAELSMELSILVMLERHYVDRWDEGASREGPEASLLKIRGTEILQALTELALDIEGPLGAVHDPADLHKSPDENFNLAERASCMANEYLYSRCWSIFGGSNEIQRNIIAKSIGL